MTRREIIKLLGQGICTAASTAAELEAANSPASQISANQNAAADNTDAAVQRSAASSARDVLTRLLGERAGRFELQQISPEDGRMVYELSASGGTVSVKGSSGVALCRGVYTYLREACKSMVVWSGRHLDLPEKFPDYPARRVTCPYRFTQYLNICDFGYSTAFWNWERWQQELDWMALHGINMALAMTGQEAIWRRVWESAGMTTQELNRYSTGPAYLPWHWMGNINRFDGPLPEGWIAQRQALQRMILRRMRELNITPIVPAFAGFVPKAFKRVCPKAKISTLLWANQGSIPMETKTFMLHPDEAELYQKIGRRFIQEYKRQFGTVEYYLADLFNEIEPPVIPGKRADELARFAQNVYHGIIAGDPDGKWVMQGWLFFADRRFWNNQSIEAFLSRIPDDRVIIINYVSDLDDQATHPLWRECSAFFGKQWMNGMIQNFGGNDNVCGKLELIATQPGEVLASPDKGNLVGWALCPEGIETNEAVFELLTDVGWSAKQIDLGRWIPSYCSARYGSYPEAMAQAWSLLLQSVYGADSDPWGKHFSWQRRPQLKPSTYNPPSAPIFQKAVERFLACSGELSSNDLYRHDLIELAAQYAGRQVDLHIAAACRAHEAGTDATRDQLAEESMNMLLQIDALMHLRPERRLETWVESARRFAMHPDELAYYDSDARRLLTFWGWVELNDYAARVWSGLIRDYYAGRWQAFFRGLKEKKPANLAIWEQAWLAWPYAPSPALHVHDLTVAIQHIFETCKGWSKDDRAVS